LIDDETLSYPFKNIAFYYILLSLNENKIPLRQSSSSNQRHIQRVRSKINILSTYIYMNVHFMHFWDWDKHFNEKWLNYNSYKRKPPHLLKWCGHSTVFHIWEQCQPSHKLGEQCCCKERSVLMLVIFTLHTKDIFVCIKLVL
jgi:hypothetical protein